MPDRHKTGDSMAKTSDTSSGGKTNDGSGLPVAVLINKKKTLTIMDIPSTLGKSAAEADVSFFHDSVANVHCRFDCKNRRLLITDLGTKTGTQVNGKKLEPGVPFEVYTGDKLVIGKVKFDLTVSHEELEKRERRAEREARRSAEPAFRTYKVKAREVTTYEYDESDVVYVSCGLEPMKKKAKYTQEINAQELQKEIEEAERRAAAERKEAERKAAERKAAERKAAERKKGSDAVYSKELRYKGSGRPGRSSKSELVLSLTYTDEETGRKEDVIIDHTPFRIGRGEGINDHVVGLKGVSREHMKITKRDGVYYVTDEVSTNGVRVNGVKIPQSQEYRVSPGDTVRISKRTYTVGMKYKK